MLSLSALRLPAPHYVFRLALVGRGLTAGGEEQLESPRQVRTRSGAGRGRARPGGGGTRGEQASFFSFRGEVGVVGCVSCRGPDQRAVNDRILRVAPGSQEGAAGDLLDSGSAGASSHCGWDQAIGADTFRDVTDPPARGVGSRASCSVPRPRLSCVRVATPVAEVAGLPRVQGQGLSQPSGAGLWASSPCPSSRLVVSGSSLAAAFALMPTELVAWVPGGPSWVGAGVRSHVCPSRIWSSDPGGLLKPMHFGVLGNTG